tara:strand:- start:78 stop:923 length:846 start_codon:yes stop_codon:yes gene_type:complete
MDDFQNDNVDLLNFINKKCHKKMIDDNKKIFFLFSKSIRLAIINTYNHQQNILLAISCTNLIVNIFWLIYNYSHNTKLTMFMCERSVLLFNEYINISKNYGNEKTNILDVKQFIINKTIGPLKFNKNTVDTGIKEMINISQMYSRFIYKLFAKVITFNNEYYTPDIFLESTTSILSNIIYKLYNIGYSDYVQDQLDQLITYEILDIPREVNLLKIKLEIVLYLYNNQINIEKSLLFADEIITKYIDIIDSADDINEFFDYTIKLQDRQFFKDLIIKVDNYT